MSVNGQYSKWFNGKSGSRQGEPLSPYLICVKILSLMVRQNKSIRGIKILDKEILLSHFAYDTSFFSMADKNHFKPV